MRKILLATTALVGFAVAGAAQAATSPLNVTVGGSVDALAGAFHESKAANGSSQSTKDFETLYAVNFGVSGKANNGVEYGAALSLDNTPEIENLFASSGNGVAVTNANIFMSGAFGKVVVGDSHGATDLALLAPVVGEGGVYGRYMDFLDTTTFAKTFIAGVDVTEHATNFTYFTPKVGNDVHKVQAGFTYEPNMYDNAASVNQKDGRYVNTGSQVAGVDKNSPYHDIFKGAVAYTGNFSPVAVGLSASVINGTADKSAQNTNWFVQNTGKTARDFTSWSIGAQAAYEGFTLGGNYLDFGHYNTVRGQTKDQQEYGVALKYEFSKVAVGVSYLGGEGYSNVLSYTTGNKYVKDFNSYDIGANYTWAPGLTTNADAVLFDQKTDSGLKNDGYVLLLSQKLAF